MDSLSRLIGADHLNAILRQAGALGESRVRDVSILSDRSMLMSRILRLGLTYDGPADNLPRSLILKTALAGQPATEWNGRQEIAFYQDVAPAIPSGLIPRCFEARHEDAGTPWHLVLEDLTDTHELATPWPLPPSDAQCRSIVGSLARLHTIWWNDPRLGVTIGTRLEKAGLQRFLGQVAAHLEVFVDRLGDELPAERRALLEEVIAAAPRLYSRYLNGTNTTLTHGDAHMWNCFLPRNEADGVRWFDWSGWRIRVPTNDLAYMIALHWYPERRRRLEPALLDHYHAALLENGVTGYDAAALREDYRASVLWQLITPVFQAGLKLPPVIWWNNYQRIMAAVDDLGCRELLG